MFREILDRALGKEAQKTDIAQMIVLIDYKPSFCDYANFSKYDPEWWFELAEDVQNNSANPELSVGLWAIAASQFFFDGPHNDGRRCREALVRGMSLKKEHPVLVTIGKAAMLSEMDALEELPKRSDVERDGLENAILSIEVFEQLVKDGQE